MFKDIFNSGKNFIMVMATIVIFILITTTCLAPIITKAEIDDKSLIITFIGVLATFVVIGNFAQVSEIRHNVEQDLAQKKIDIEKAQTTANGLKNEVDTNSTNIMNVDKRIEKLERSTDKQLDDLTATITEQRDIHKLYTQDAVNKALKYLENYKFLVLNQIVTLYGETNSVVSLLMKLHKRSEQEEYVIQVSANADIIKASAKIFDDKIEFYEDKKLIDSETIESIDRIQIKARALFTLYSLYSDAIISSAKTELSDNIYTNTENEKGNDDSENTFNNKPEK